MANKANPPKPPVQAGGDPPAPEQSAADFNNNLGDTIGGFCTAVVEADSLAKDAQTARILSLLKRPNAQFVADVSVIGSEEPLQVRIDTPVIAITNIQPIEITTAELELDMTVETAINDASETKGNVEGKGEASIGIGPFSAKVSVSASASYSSAKSRKSDYRARTNVKVQFAQGTPAEGLSLIMQSVNRFVDVGTAINKQIVEAQLPKFQASAAKTPDVKPAQPSK